MKRANRTTIAVTAAGLALACLAAPAAQAYSFLNASYGTVELGLSARVRAMGGAGSGQDQGAYGLVDNPATLALGSGNGLQADGYLARVSENRFVPIYDTFDSYVTENAVSVNDHEFGALQGGFTWAPGTDLDLVLGAGVYNRYDPRYLYRNEIGTTGFGDRLDSLHTISTEGVIRSVSAGAALGFEGGHGVGVALNYYYGTLDGMESMVDRQVPGNNSQSRVVRKLDGFSVTVGGTARLSERVRVSASVETAPDLDSDNTGYENWDTVDLGERESTTLKLPLRAQAGFIYRPRNTLKTTFAADVVYMPWSELEDGLRDEDAAGLDDTWEARFGLEHVFYNDLGGRLGFRYGNSYGLENADVASFTFGFGYALKQVGLDIGAEINKRDSRQEPLTDRANQPTAPSTSRDRVEDTWLRVFFGVDYRF